MNAPGRRRIAVWAVTASVLFLVLLLFCFFTPRSFLPAYSIPAREQNTMRVHFLSVGEGDCSVVEFPSGRTFVIDASDGGLENANHVIRYLKGIQMTSLTLILTHTDYDHYGGMSAIVKQFEVDAVYLPVLPSESDAYRSLLSLLEHRAIRTETATRYCCIAKEEGAYAVCLSPYSAGETDENDSSAVLYFHYAGVSALFPGDISSTRERRLLSEYALDETLFNAEGCPVRLSGIQLLKVAHHGSSASTCAPWLALLNPEVAVISCGRNNSLHPAGETLERLKGIDIYRTDECGDITVCISENGYTVSTKI